MDSDAPRETLALDIGKCLHQCLEDTNHELKGYTAEKIRENMERYDVPPSKYDLLEMMLRNYRDLHEASDLKCVVAEERLQNDEFIGFIDAIMEDKEGRKWIVDVKTAARKNQFLPSKLPRDKQLNLYLYELSKAYDVAGCRYRVVYKSKSGGAEEYTIPREVMDPEGMWEQFRHLRARQEQLWAVPRLAKKNFNNCDSYFRPCEYWSRCHGANYTDSPRVTCTAI